MVIIWFVFAAVLVVGWIGHIGMHSNRRRESLPLSRIVVTLLFAAVILPFIAFASSDWQLVRRVVDADTLVLRDGERVRLIGIDTLKTKHPKKPEERFGKEAAAFARNLAQRKRVRLEYDQANAPTGHKDRYGRTLAYVFLEDGTLLNAEIIKEGYGFASTQSPFERMEEFHRLEGEARQQERGLWGTP